MSSNHDSRGARDGEQEGGRGAVDELEALAAVEGLGSFGAGTLGRDAWDVIDERHVEEFEAAAGLVFRALGQQNAGPAPPEDLAERLFAATYPRAFRATAAPARVQESPARSSTPRPASRAVTDSDRPGRKPTPPVAWVGWLVAAGLALYLGLGRPSEAPYGSRVEGDLRARAEALASSEGAVVAPWSVGDLEGSVVWSDAANTGFMRIAGLPVNDPQESQYQLWIFRGKDPAAEPHPVDGGVFDVPSTGEAVVPIDAKLDVGSAGLFAITVEKPGGVVVSGRESIVAVAVRG